MELELKSGRFATESGVRVTVQVPDAHVQAVSDAVLNITPLQHGDYDRVTFKTTTGTQRFRSLGTGRNPATADILEVPCAELSFFLADNAILTEQVLNAIYTTHPYEEPVVFVVPCLRTLHIRGMDEENPDKFWNGEAQDWIPEEHCPTR